MPDCIKCTHDLRCVGRPNSRCAAVSSSSVETQPSRTLIRISHFFMHHHERVGLDVLVGLYIGVHISTFLQGCPCGCDFIRRLPVSIDIFVLRVRSLGSLRSEPGMAEAVADYGASCCAPPSDNHLERHKDVHFYFSAQLRVQQPFNKALTVSPLDALDDPSVEELNDRGAVRRRKQTARFPPRRPV